MAVDGTRTADVTELQTRIASAAVLAPVALAALVFGGLPFAAFVTLVAAIGFWEWTEIAGVSERVWRAAALVCLVLGLLALQSFDARLAAVLLIVPGIAALLVGFQHHSFRWIGLGLVYVAIPAAGLILLRQAAAPVGWGAILFILAVVWATDIAAYFAGRGLGGPKLWLRVSPKKTWSGAIGGLAAALMAGGLVVALTGVAGFLERRSPCSAAFGRGAGRRPSGISFEAEVRREGFRYDHSWPWRRS